MIKQKELFVYSEITQQTFLAFSASYGSVIEGVYNCPVFGFEVSFSFNQDEFDAFVAAKKFVIIGEV